MLHAEYSNRTHLWKTVRDLALIVLLTILSYLGFRTLEVTWPEKDNTPYYPLHLIPLLGAIVTLIYLIRKNHWEWKLPLGRTVLLILSAAIINLVFSLRIYDVLSAFPYAWASMVSVLFIAYALLRRIGLVLIGLFLFVEALQNAAFLLFGIEIDAFVLQQILAANADEIKMFLTSQNIGVTVIAVIGIAALLYVIHRTMKGSSRAALLLWGMMSLFLTLLIAGVDPGCPIGKYSRGYPAVLYPFTRIHWMVDTDREASEKTVRLLSHFAQLPSPAEKISEIHSVSPNSGVVCILHIGESVRADHLPMNGYGRDTTPSINRFREHTVNFSDCVSSFPYTLYAVPVILTDARRTFNDDGSILSGGSCGSVMDLFRKHGFYCSVYYESSYEINDPYSKLLRSLAKTTHEYIVTPRPTDKQTDRLCENLQDRTTNEFVLMYNTGSHMPYYNFTPDLSPFHPSSDDGLFWSKEKTAQQRENIVNRYDNTIYCTDYNIGRVLDSLRGRPYIYIYTSDHGDPLGECGLWDRDASVSDDKAYHALQTCKVPLFIIYSPEFEALHPHFAEALKQLKQNTGKRVAHEHIFHTLLGIFAISSPYYDASLDLCRPDVQPYSGLHPDDVKKAE